MSNFGDSFFNMFVLMTTSNYPDVMLPSYQENRLNFLFFGSYLIIGLFLIMNLLLAIIYSNFKTRFEESIEGKEDARTTYLYDQFCNIIKDDKRDHMKEHEMYQFFMVIHSLVENNYQDEFDEEEERAVKQEINKAKALR